jgi:hypothetical protein
MRKGFLMSSPEYRYSRSAVLGLTVITRKERLRGVSANKDRKTKQYSLTPSGFSCPVDKLYAKATGGPPITSPPPKSSGTLL